MSFEQLTSKKTQIHTIDDGLTLESGNRLPQVHVAYRTWGQLSAGRDNAVLVCHALTGSADADEWWPGLIGRGLALDPDHDFIICSNALGSCYGTTGPSSLSPRTGAPYGPDFPLVTVRDVVSVQKRLLEDLGVRHLRLVIGGSFGGMQALEWTVSHGSFLDSAVVIATTARHSPWCIGLSEAQRAAIRADDLWREGRYDLDHQPSGGLAVARMIAMCSYRSPESFQDRFGRQEDGAGCFQTETYLRHHGHKLADRFDANSYLTLTRAMDTHDVSRGRGELKQVLGSIDVETLVIGITSDRLYLPAEQIEIAEAVPHARLVWLHAPHGHDAFLIETADVCRLVGDFRGYCARRARPLAS